MSQKRNRSINWDEEEKQLFRSVLKEYVPIIENKSLDTNTNKIKTKAWQEVHRKFNHINKRPRELGQLKIQWKGMKVNVRKTFSSFKKETNKTGGGERPATPDESIIEIRDLLNPAELLRDQNPYDSDGLVIGELELSAPSEIIPINIQNTCIEICEDVDMACGIKETGSLAIPQENWNKPTDMDKNTSIPLQSSEDDIVMMTPMKKATGATPAKKVTKRKLMANITDSGRKPRKNHEDYINNMIMHSKMLKDEEHMRKMEMAEEEHVLKINQLKEETIQKKEEHVLKINQLKEETIQKKEEHVLKINQLKEENIQKKEENELKIDILKEKKQAAILERRLLESKIAHEINVTNK